MYYAFLIIEGLFKITPSFLLNFLKYILSEIFYLLPIKRKKIVLKNLEIMGYDKKLAKKLAKKFYFHFIDNLFEFIEFSSITKEKLIKKILFKNEDKILELIQKSPVIFVTAHYNNWEVMPNATASFIAPLDIVVRKLDNEKLNEKIEKNRRQFGVDVFDKRGGLRSLVKSIKNGKSIGILVDQYPGDDKGIVTTFFNKPVRHTEVAAVLSKKFNIPIVMSFVDKVDDKYIIEFVDIFYTDDIQKSVDRQAKVTEEYIKTHGVEKWYLFHRRFRPWEKYE